MMSVLFMLLFMIFIFNSLSLKLLQFYYQNFIFFLTFYYLLKSQFSSFGWVQLYYFLGCDYYSIGLVLLSFWILSLMILMSLNNLINLSYLYYINILNFMLIFLLMCFMSLNLMMFYLFFESSLIPIFLLIMGWGFQVDRIQASFYMMLYTLLGSMPLFLLILLIYSLYDTLNMPYIEINSLSVYMYISLILAFLIKIPLYFSHLWLPKAHVEAPLVGSMILAGVMLKLGGYGLLRILPMMLKMSMQFNKFIMVISLIGGVYSSLICLSQNDMKMLVAYSSVVHMSLLISGIMTLYKLSFLGSILIMISHGLCSSGLFVLVNLNYERLNTRSLLLNKGMINIFPSLSLMWFLLCSSNMSFPPSLNLWGEIMLINCLIMWNEWFIFIIILILIFSSSYTLYLYSFSQHGCLSNLNYLIKSVSVLEFMNLLLHWMPLNFLFMIMYLFMV